MQDKKLFFLFWPSRAVATLPKYLSNLEKKKSTNLKARSDKLYILTRCVGNSQLRSVKLEQFLIFAATRWPNAVLQQIVFSLNEP